MADSTAIVTGNSASMGDLPTQLRQRLQGHRTVQHTGRVVRAVGTSLRVTGLPVRIGERCEVRDARGDVCMSAEVVGFEQHEAILFPLGGLRGVALDAEVRVASRQATIGVSDALLGRVLDGFGQPLDDQPLPAAEHQHALVQSAPNPLLRQRVDQRLETGVKVIDSLLTLGHGQRVGVFASAGAGKSTLLGMLAGASDIDVIVVGLIGERGREVREFLEDTLDEHKRSRSVIVVATSDRPAMERINAAYTATAIAEGFRDNGKRVLLLMDSVTRYARAIREVGLAAGEPAVRHGFTPSVFAELPRLYERAGTGINGSITAFFTVLTDDDDASDPIAEETRSILDGNIVLSRKLGEKGHFPAIDVLGSISRLFPKLVDHQQQQMAERVRMLLAKYRDIEFLLQVGEYRQGTDADADAAVSVHVALDKWMKQSIDDRVDATESLAMLKALLI